MPPEFSLTMNELYQVTKINNAIMHISTAWMTIAGNRYIHNYSLSNEPLKAILNTE